MEDLGVNFKTPLARLETPLKLRNVTGKDGLGAVDTRLTRCSKCLKWPFKRAPMQHCSRCCSLSFDILMMVQPDGRVHPLVTQHVPYFDVQSVRYARKVSGSMDFFPQA